MAIVILPEQDDEEVEGFCHSCFHENPEIESVPLVQEQAPPGAHAKNTPPECATPPSDPPTVPSTKALNRGSGLILPVCKALKMWKKWLSYRLDAF